MKSNKFLKIAGLLIILFVNLCVFNINSSHASGVGGSYGGEIIFKPAIPIPGMDLIFGSNFDKTTGKITINPGTLGLYISTLYKFFVGALAIVAVVMIMIAGFRWLFAAGSSERVSKAKEMISNSIVGLVIALTSYLLFNVLNPNLVNYQPLLISAIPKEVLAVGVVSGTEVFPTTGGLQGVYFIASVSVEQWQEETTKALQKAANIYAGFNDPTQKELIVISGTRTVTYQRFLYNSICGNTTPCNKVCGPGPNNDFATCPHVMGVAVDIWHNGEYINQNMVTAMKQAGFCQLSNEPWHFEYPKLSPSCNP